MFYKYFLPLPPLRGQPAVAMPTLFAPQEGTDKFMQVEGCLIRRFEVLRKSSLTKILTILSMHRFFLILLILNLCIPYIYDQENYPIWWFSFIMFSFFSERKTRKNLIMNLIF